MNSLRRIVLILSAGSAFALAGMGTATAADAPQITVSYKDLDLSRAADARVLYRRLQAAATEVCQPVPANALSRTLAWKQCYDAALERAVTQINAPQLVAVYHADTSTMAGRG
jgi:UrcA family protein